MQNPNEDTEWNDILRAKGILPPKQEEPTISEDTVVQVSLVQYIAYVWAMEALPQTITIGMSAQYI